MYLTFEEYSSLGGKTPASEFDRLENLARKRLDYWTMNRISQPDDDVKLCMSIIIDAEYDEQSDNKDVASFSNDGVSVSFADVKTSEEKWQIVYNRIVEILPVDMVSICV